MAPETTYLDLKGLKCPLPVIRTRKRLRMMAEGEELTVDTTDPLAGIDIPHFCREEGHELLAGDRSANGHRFVIRCGAALSKDPI